MTSLSDPRLQGRPRTVNERIADAMILRATFLERLKAQIAFERSAALRRGLGKLIKVVESALKRIANRGVGALDQKGFQNLMKRADELSTAAYGAAMGGLAVELTEIATIESQWLAGTFSRFVPDIGISFDAPTAETLRSIARKRPFQGRTLREWIGKLDADTQARVRAAVRTGVSEGQTVRQIVRRLTGTKALGYADGAVTVSDRELRSVVGSAVQHTVTQTREDTYRANEDLIASVQWVATLDLVTCPICGSYDGKTWDVGKGPRPPAHPHCRCSTAPALKSWRALGIPADSLPAGTRASMSGEVPADLNWDAWMKRRSVREQNAAMGRGMAQLFREGRIGTPGNPLDPGKILGADRRRLTIAQIRAMN